MYHAFIMAFLIFFLLPVIAGTSLPPRHRRVVSEAGIDLHNHICPDGLPGLVTQIQYARLDPFQTDIYITSCSSSRHTTSINPSAHSDVSAAALQARQEPICPANCSNTCSSGGITPSTSDCNTLITYLNNRDTTWNLDGDGIRTESSGTCSFQIVNMDDSPVTYCDTGLAGHGNSVMNQCVPSSSGGMCKGSRFYVGVFGTTASSPSPSPAQSSDSSASSQGTGSNGSNTGSNGLNNGNSGNGNSSSGNANNSEGGATTANGASSGTSQTVSNAGAVPSSGGQSNAISGHTGDVNVVSTTLSNGQIISITMDNVSLPTGSAISANTGLKATNHSTNIPAIVGGLLGAIAIIALIIAFFMWRRKQRRQKERIHSDEHLPNSDQYLETNADDIIPSPGGGTPMAEVAAPGLWATSAKARMVAEERRGNSESLTRSSVPRTGPSTSESYILPYRSRSGRRREHHSRTESGGTDPHRDRDHHHRQHNDSASGSDTLSSVTRSSHPSQATSARTFARAAAPNLTASDIDRLAETIMARMQGRDPNVHERAVMEEDEDEEDEPPPPWSAPVHDRHAPQV